ncbi:MAG: hypothetical protein F6K08_30660 [Okeania sp. SIO1H6]|nr:hypothetical protein [Okeania sp. SIO1H6]
MPNINLNTLRGIPGVDKDAMTQNNDNACGAYAIIGAVGAFEVFPKVATLAYANHGPEEVNNTAQIANNNNYHQLSAAAYKVTGILSNKGLNQPPVKPELLKAGNVYNSPAAMAKVAQDLGRQVQKINVQPDGFGPLNRIYPGARPRCEGVVGQANVIVDAGNYAAPGQQQTHVVCVNNGTGGLHWVAQGSDGKFYDPANGSVNNTWNPIKTGDPMGYYYFAGLWMVIS